MAHEDREETRLLSVRFPAEELKVVQAIARAECRTLSGHIRFLVKKDLEERGEKSWTQ